MTRSKSPATPQRDAGGGIAVGGGMKILCRIWSTGCILFHSTVLGGGQKDVKDMKVT